MAAMSASRLGKGSSPCLQALACKTFCPSCAGLISTANGFAESCPPDRSLAVTATSEWLARGAPMWGRIAQRKKRHERAKTPLFSTLRSVQRRPMWPRFSWAASELETSGVICHVLAPSPPPPRRRQDPAKAPMLGETVSPVGEVKRPRPAETSHGKVVGDATSPGSIESSKRCSKRVRRGLATEAVDQSGDTPRLAWGSWYRPFDFTTTPSGLLVLLGTGHPAWPKH